MADEIKKSIKMEISAEDKASASVEKISKRMLDDMAKLDRQIFNAGATAKQRELRDVDEHMARLRQRYEGNAAMQAKIAEAAAAKAAEVQRKHSGGGSMGVLQPLLSMGVAIGAARVGIAAINAGMADMAFQAASATGSVTEMYEAWEKSREATKQIAASVPFIGAALSTAMSMLGDSPGLEKAVKAVEKVKADTEKTVALAKAWGNELEIAAAKARGATQGEMDRLTRGQKQAGREDEIKAAEERLSKAKTALNDANHAREMAEAKAYDENAIARGENGGLSRFNLVDRVAATYRQSAAEDAELLAGRAAQEAGVEVQKQQKALDDARAKAAKLAEAEEQQARNAAEKAKQEAAQKLTLALMSEEDKRLAASADHWAEVRKLAKESSYTLADYQAKATEIVRAEEADRAKIKEDFSKQAADKERQIQEQAGNDINDFAREEEGRAKERERKASDAARAKQEKSGVAEEMLRNMGLGKQADAMARKRKYDTLREKYAGDAGMLALVNAGEKAERNSLSKEQKSPGSVASFAGSESRFLTRAAGRDAGAELISETKTQTQTLETALKALPTGIAEQVKTIINIGVL